VHFYFCILIFIFNFITVFIKVLFFYRCLDIIVYIVPFIIVLYLSIQLQNCQSVLINLLTYLMYSKYIFRLISFVAHPSRVSAPIIILLHN